MTWIQTRRGRAFDLEAPRAEDVDFAEIGFALARINRFTGHAGAYSVAQHCAHGCDYLLSRGERVAALHFLLHDAHEAYLGDISSPVQARLSSLSGFRSLWSLIKHEVDSAIYAAAHLTLPTPELAARVHEIDLAMLRAERDQLLGAPPKPWLAAVEQAPFIPAAIDRVAAPEIAERRWLQRFRNLTTQLGEEAQTWRMNA